MDPQQEIFTALRSGLKKMGYDVYDEALPPEDTPYPFVYLSDSTQDDSDTKNQIIGTVDQTIKVWVDSPTKRGTLSKILNQIKEFSRNIRETKTYGWGVQHIYTRILPDTSVKPPVMQGILEIKFRFF